MGSSVSSRKASSSKYWQRIDNAFNTAYSETSSVRSKTTGAKSRSNVNVNVKEKISKSKVYKGIFNNAKKYGKTFGRYAKKGAMFLGKSPNFWSIAFQVVTTVALNYEWDDEEGDFVREIPNANYLCAIPNFSGSHVLITGEQCLEIKGHIVVELPKQFTSRDLDVYKKGLCERAAGQYNYIIQDILDKNPGYSLDYLDYGGWSCYLNGKPGGVWVYSRLYYGTSTIKTALTYDEFADLLDSRPGFDPSYLVGASADEEGMIDLDEDPKIGVANGTTVISDPYTNPSTGTVQQSKFKFKIVMPNGEIQVSEEIEERPDIKPNTEETPLAKPAPTETPSSTPTSTPTADGVDSPVDSPDGVGSPDKTTSSLDSDLCEKHPDALACQKMGSLDNFNFDDVVIPTTENNETFQPDYFLPLNGVCPEPKSFTLFGREYIVSYVPMCTLAEKLRFLVILGFTLISASFVFGGLRGK